MDVEELWAGYADDHDVSSRDGLILHYLPLVERSARQLHAGLPSSVELDDLVSYGTFGLIDAIEKFEPDLGFKFETYAPQRIRGSILDGMRSMDWVPRNVRARAKAVDESSRQLAIKLGRTPTDDEVADDLRWPVETVQSARIERSHVVSLADPLAGSDSEDEPSSLGDLLSTGAQPSDSIDMDTMRERLAEAIGSLDEREQTVLVLYYFERLRFSEIGSMYGVSESRVCQIHMKAVESIRTNLINT